MIGYVFDIVLFTGILAIQTFNDGGHKPQFGGNTEIHEVTY